MSTPPAIQELVAYNQDTDAPIEQLEVAVGHSSFGDTPKRAPYIGSSETSGNTLLGTELVPSTGWTSTGWTGNSVTGYIHTAGNTTALLNSLAAIIDNLYQISFIVATRTAGTFTVAFGGITSGAYSATSAFNIKATGTGSLSIVPTTDFNGTIIILIKQITWELTGAEILALLEKDDVVSLAEAQAAFVAKVIGSSLIADTEIARLLTVKGNPYQINLPAGDLTTKIAGATFLPVAWATIAVNSSVNAMITHILTGRKVSFVNIFEIDGADESLLSFDKGTAYSGIKGNGATVLISGIAPTSLAVRIELIFD